MRVAPDSTTVLSSRNNKDFTARFPELAGVFASALHGRAAVFDGEIVVLDDAGRPDFALLQNHRAGRRPARFFAFDLLQLGEIRLLDAPYRQRRELLTGLTPAPDSAAAIPPTYNHADLNASGLSPQDLLGLAAQNGLEGLVAKATTSPYQPRRRSPDWLKHPLIRTQEVILGGWHPGEGRRA
jgi:bifunctional non-homologous end joining protein LigD